MTLPTWARACTPPRSPLVHLTWSLVFLGGRLVVDTGPTMSYRVIHLDPLNTACLSPLIKANTHWVLKPMDNDSGF